MHDVDYKQAQNHITIALCASQPRDQAVQGQLPGGCLVDGQLAIAKGKVIIYTSCPRWLAVSSFRGEDKTYFRAWLTQVDGSPVSVAINLLAVAPQGFRLKVATAAAPAVPSAVAASLLSVELLRPGAEKRSESDWVGLTTIGGCRHRW